MASVSELLLPENGFIAQRDRARAARSLIVVRNSPARRTPDTSLIEDMTRDRAKDALKSNGILYDLELVEGTTSTDRSLALDFRFESFRPVGVVRWAPSISTETGLVISKAVKVVSSLKSKMPDIYYAIIDYRKGDMQAYWQRFNPAVQDVAESSLPEIIRLAMSGTTDKIEDSRDLVGDIYIGNPGFGNIK